MACNSGLQTRFLTALSESRRERKNQSVLRQQVSQMSRVPDSVPKIQMGTSTFIWLQILFLGSSYNFIFKRGF